MGVTLSQTSFANRILRIPAAIVAVLFVFANHAVADDTTHQNVVYGGLVEVAVGDALDIPAWSHVAALIDRDENQLAACANGGTCADDNVAAFASFLEQVKDLAPGEQVQAVNDHFNRLPYVADDVMFGVEDLWQSPLAFADGAGDCEDYAIAKYTALRMLGFAEESLRLIVLMDEGRGIPHAVLEVHAYGQVWVMDNLSSRADVAMDEDYRPLYALNEEDRWVFVPADSPEQEVAFGRPASGN